MLNGLILCGGDSSRMKTDKGLIKSNNSSYHWVQNMIHLISPYVENVIVSVSQKNESEYYKLSLKEEILVDETANIQGPLRGIYTAYQKYSKSDFLVLTCDIQLMDQKMIEKLINFYSSNQKSTCFEDVNGLLNPFPAIFSCLLLSQNIQNKERKGPLSLLNNTTKINKIKILEEEMKYFVNFNTQKDIQNAFPI